MALSPLISRHILPFTLKLLYASLRISVTPPSLKKQLSRKGVIFTFWHGKMITGWLLARDLFPDKNIVAVVSQSEDGQALSDTLEKLEFSLIRGSSSKGGDEVKLEMQGALHQKSIIVLTPDGPRGPVNQFKYGTLRMAARNHCPLIFAEICYANAWKLKSWDKFEIPKPFTRTIIKLHSIEVPELETEEKLRIYTTNLSDRLGHA